MWYVSYSLRLSEEHLLHFLRLFITGLMFQIQRYPLNKISENTMSILLGNAINIPLQRVQLMFSSFSDALIYIESKFSINCNYYAFHIQLLKKLVCDLFAVVCYTNRIPLFSKSLDECVSQRALRNKAEFLGLLSQEITAI